MSFGKSLYRVINCILATLPKLSPIYERSATSPDSGYSPLQPSRNEAESPALFMTSPVVASMKQSPRAPTKRQ